MLLKANLLIDLFLQTIVDNQSTVMIQKKMTISCLLTIDLQEVLAGNFVISMGWWRFQIEGGLPLFQWQSEY